METRLRKSLPNCSICYDKVERRGELEDCMHIFCFQCIAKWAEIQNTCPVCKTRFTAIRQQLMRNNYKIGRSRNPNPLIIQQRSQKQGETANLSTNFSIEELTLALLQIVESNPQLLQQFLQAEILQLAELLLISQNTIDRLD